MMKRLSLMFAFFFLDISLGHADYRTHVMINGVELNFPQLYALQTHLHKRIRPGNYIVNHRSDCWFNWSSGAGEKNCVEMTVTFIQERP